MDYDTRLDIVCKERGIWAGARYPGMCWIVENVLGLNPANIAFEDFGPYGYSVIEFDDEGRRMYNEQDGLITKYHPWTTKQIELLGEWSDFIPSRFK